MARIAGVDLPNNKRGEIGLTYIFGIGRSSAKKILDKCGIDGGIKCGEWNDAQIAAIRAEVGENYKIEESSVLQSRWTSRGLWISVAIEASVTVTVFLYADRAPRTMHAPERVERRLLLTRRRQPSNN